MHRWKQPTSHRNMQTNGNLTNKAFPFQNTPDTGMSSVQMQYDVNQELHLALMDLEPLFP